MIKISDDLESRRFTSGRLALAMLSGALPVSMYLRSTTNIGLQESMYLHITSDLGLQASIYPPRTTDMGHQRSCQTLKSDSSKEELLHTLMELPQQEINRILDAAGHLRNHTKSIDVLGSTHNESVYPWKTAIFLGACAYVLCCLLRLIFVEYQRYVKNDMVMKAPDSFSAYLRYRFNHWYTWTPSAPGVVLCSLCWALLLLGATLLCVLTDTTVSESLWSAWIWIAAPDGGGSANDPKARFVGVVVSCGGMLIFALLLSFISSTVEESMQSLRSGKGGVVESNHMVILGWSPILPILLGELCNAAESRGGDVFVLLTQVPKPELEDMLQDYGVDFRNSTVVVRSGEEHCKDELLKVAIESASKVVVLSRPGLSRDDSDSWSMNVLVSLCNLDFPPNVTRVFQCELVRNQRLFKSLSNVPTEVITAGDFVGSLMVQSSRQRGLAGVINSIFGFDGDEFYIHQVRGTAGLCFQDLMFAFEEVVACGYQTADGELQLLPPMDTVLKCNENLILLAEDASTLPHCISDRRLGTTSELRRASKKLCSKEHVLQQQGLETQCIIVIGHNESIGSVLLQIDGTVAPGSEVVLFSPQSEEIRQEFIEDAQRRRRQHFKNFTMSFQTGPMAARFRLEALPILKASRIFFLADSSSSPTEVSAQTVAGILQVQAILAEGNNPAECSVLDRSSPVIIPQILDQATEKSCTQLQVQDYINSNELAARLLAVVSESPHVSGIINQIVAEDGCDFIIRRLDEYATLDSIDLSGKGGITFDEVAAVAAVAGEIALGWSEVGAGSLGPWEMNPKEKGQRRPWNSDARVVALKRIQI